MNKKWIISWKIWIALLVLVLVALIAWPFLHRGVSSASETAKARPNTVAPVHEIPAVAVKNMEDAEAKRVKALDGLTLAKSSVIYAKVVDQAGAPVSGAKVVIASAMSASPANQSVEQTSDVNGTFTFFKKWPVLSITVVKPGYQNLLASSATFQYAKTAFTPPSKSDPDDPVLFVLQRM
jgi:cytoskeletal protein RodZ